MVKSKSETRILVVGAGSAGCLVAQSLKKQGYSPRLFERDVALGARPRDWNFGIYWAQSNLAECVPEHMVEQIINDGQVDSKGISDKTMFPWYNSYTGEEMHSVPIPNQMRLHRKNFIRILASGLDIEFGKRLKTVDSDGTTVTLTFEDGTTAEGDVFISAEGAHSQAREYLVGKEAAKPMNAPLAASYTIATLSPEAARFHQEAHPRMYAHNNPEGNLWISSVHDAWDSKKPGEWQAMILVSRKCDVNNYDPSKLQGDDILRDMKTIAKGYNNNFKTIIDSIPDGTKCWHNQLSYWKPRPWDNRNGTITLVGDAAHPMTYHRGQGLNNAILDCAKLARSIREHGVLRENGKPSGIDVYEKEMWARGAEAVQVSLDNSIALHTFETMDQSPLFVNGALRKTREEAV